MDAIQLIQKDHREVEALFRAFERAERAGDHDALRATSRAIVRELSVHAAIEEQFVYPALRGSGEEGAVLDALEEHHATKVTLLEIDALPVTSDRFAPKMHVLASAVRQHVAEEEQRLLPRLERTLDEERLRALAATLEAARKTAPTRPHPAAPDTPPGVFVAGAVAAVYDRLRDALRGATALLRSLATRSIWSSVDGLRSLAVGAQAGGRAAMEQVRERGREVMDEALEQGRSVAEDVRERGREAGAETRRRGMEAAARAERGVGAVAGRVQVMAEQAARTARPSRRVPRKRSGGGGRRGRR